MPLLDFSATNLTISEAINNFGKSGACIYFIILLVDLFVYGIYYTRENNLSLNVSYSQDADKSIDEQYERPGAA